MKNKMKLNGGYIGILMLLIGVAIIVFIMFKKNVFFGQTYSVEKENGIENNTGENMIDRGNGYIDQAQQAKDLLEKNSQKTMVE